MAAWGDPDVLSAMIVFSESFLEPVANLKFWLFFLSGKCKFTVPDITVIFF